MSWEDPVESVWTDVGGAVLEEPRWVVRNILPAGITFLAGPPKSFKSTVELALALTVCGVQNDVLPPEFADAPDTGIVMGLSMEASAGVLRHTAEVGFKRHIPEDGSFLVMSDPWRFRLDQRHDVEELLRWVQRIGPKMLFIDPLRNCHSLDENDSGGMVMMLQPIQQFAVRTGLAVVIVHHSKKLGDKDGAMRNANANDMRGTSALFGMADAVLTCTGKPNNSVHIDAILKRGEPWQKTFQLGIWNKPKAVEPLTPQAVGILNLLRSGLSPTLVQKMLNLSPGAWTDALKQLEAHGDLTGAQIPVTNANMTVFAAAKP